MIPKVNKNVLSLMKYYGLERKGFCAAIDVATNTLSGWEKGSPIPKKSLLKIATFFNVTIDDLHNEDYTVLNSLRCSIGSREKWLDIQENVLPILKTENNTTDNYFKMGYELHIHLCEKNVNEEDVNKCMEYYEESLLKYRTPESAANMLWWYWVIGVKVRYSEEYLDGIDAWWSKHINENDFRDYYILQADDSINRLNNNDKANQYFDEYEEDIIELIKILRETIEGTQIAEYYVAIRYLWNILHNDKSYAMNQSIGMEMMSYLYDMDNPYARLYMDKMMKLVDNSK